MIYHATLCYALCNVMCTSDDSFFPGLASGSGPSPWTIPWGGGVDTGHESIYIGCKLNSGPALVAPHNTRTVQCIDSHDSSTALFSIHILSRSVYITDEGKKRRNFFLCFS